MSRLQTALALAEKGFWIFPLVGGAKVPAVDAFPKRATTNPNQILAWWQDPVFGWEQDYNIGISTSNFGANGEALLVVDVDNKEGKTGDADILKLELDGLVLPETFTQTTPTGGRHLVYRVPEAVKQGTGVLGPSVDTRSRGGYIVGADSQVDAGKYDFIDRNGDVRSAPQWLIDRCGQPHISETSGGQSSTYQSLEGAAARARIYLRQDAPVAIQGDGGDHAAYMVAARTKDLGLNQVDAVQALMEYWNPRCEPPWSYEEIQKKVSNAYRYGSSPVGIAAPETQFQQIETNEKKDEARMHPFLELNKEYAFVVSGGKSHILWETKSADGNPKLEHLDIETFHKKFAPDKITAGDRSQPLSEMWMKSFDRRSYDGICFMPGLESPKRFYNLWHGFAVEPLEREESGSSGDIAALQMFKEHALSNVCGDDEDLFNWLIGYFAHIVQKPWEKPLVALAFRGKKGVGKNALVNIIGKLLGNHYMLTANRRYLLGNFNGHLENLLLFVLDEAYWSGDKQAEGVLKDLITGDKHLIEHKGQGTYEVANRLRVVIIGNEKWIVPASEDERRYAVFDVGDGRIQDRNFFRLMRESMERGGYRLLLRYLLDFDLSKTDPNAAPQTAALLDQKINSLEPVHQWWFECLCQGRIVSSEFTGNWPKEIEADLFRAAFKRYIRDHNISGRISTDVGFGMLMHKCAPEIKRAQKRGGAGERIRVYEMPDLIECRLAWNEFIGHSVDWLE